MRKDWLEKIKALMQGRKKPPSTPALDSTAIQQLVIALKHTKNEEMDCAEVYNLIDQFVELTLQGEDTQKLLPLVHHHLEMCRDCREEYEALKDILTNFPGT
jgi:hypothetical protein